MRIPQTDADPVNESESKYSGETAALPTQLGPAFPHPTCARCPPSAATYRLPVLTGSGFLSFGSPTAEPSNV